MNPSKSPRTVASLIVGIVIAVTLQSNAALLFDGTDSKAVLDGSYLNGSTNSNYTFEMWTLALTETDPPVLTRSGPPG
jgi:hypothetical protein